MLKEFAVDPRVACASWANCQLMLSVFGGDKGRVISRFPKAWKKQVHDCINAVAELDGLSKERLLQGLARLCDASVLVPTGRSYPDSDRPWFENAVLSHHMRPFAGILTDRDDWATRVVSTESIHAAHDIFAATISRRISRSAASLAEAADFLLVTGRLFRVVDPHFKIYVRKWQRSLEAFVRRIPTPDGVTLEIHTIDDVENEWSNRQIRDGLTACSARLPDGLTLKLVRWKKRDGDDRFHERYFMTPNFGLQYGGGLDEGPAHETTQVNILSAENHLACWSELNFDSGAFELLQPVLQISANGIVIETNEF